MFIMDIMNRKIDLHTHSNASDGIYAPAELIAKALENNIIALAVTDHDTIDGLLEADEYARGTSVRFVPGIEFSIEYSGGTFHLIGLYIDYNNKSLRSECKRLAQLRNGRAQKIIEDLERHNINISIKEVEDESHDGTIGRPHIARVMVKHGYGKNINDIFQNFLVKGKPGYAKKERLKLEAALSLIADAGGIPIIAHPVTLNISDERLFEEMLADFIEKGGKGIEVYSNLHTLEDVTFFLKMADKYNLIISGGSDFHGDKEEIMGNFAESEMIPVEIFYEMERLYRF